MTGWSAQFALGSILSKACIPMKNSRILTALALTAILLAWASPTHAQTSITWNGGTDTNFATAGNWVGGIAPTSSLTANIGVFSGTPTANQPWVNAARSINGLNFASAGWALSGPANTTNLSVGGGGILSSGSGTNTISARISLGADQTWAAASGNTLVFNGPLITGSGNNLTLGSSGNTGTITLNPSAFNHLGAAKTNTLAFGTINVNTAGGLGANSTTVVINDGITLNNTSGSAVTTSTTYTNSINGNFTWGGSNAFALNGATALGVASGTSRTITANGTEALTLGGVISNGTTANSLIKDGSGGLTLSGNNTFTGGVTLSNGTLTLDNNGALGTGTFTIAGGTIQSTAASRSMTNAQTWNGNFTFGSSNSATFSGPVSLGTAVGTARTVTIGSGVTLTNSGAIANGTTANSLVKAGAGTLLLSASNTFTGGTVVNGGVLRVNDTGSLGDAAGAVTINDGGTLSIGISYSTATTAHDLIVSGNSAFAITGANRVWGVGNGSQTVTGSGTLNFDLGSLALTLNSAVNLDSGSTIAFGASTGTYVTGGTSNNGSTNVNFDLGSGSLTFRISSLTSTAKTTDLGSLSGGANTILEGSTTLNAVIDTAKVGALNTSTTFAGTIRDGTGAGPKHVVALEKVGSGTLTLSGNNSYSSTTTVTGGTLKLDAAKRIGRRSHHVGHGRQRGQAAHLQERPGEQHRGRHSLRRHDRQGGRCNQ
jgi:fibronectin-binding autotransporter adhesin